MSKKLTIDYIRRAFEFEGYELLSEFYINAVSKLKYRCPKGHTHSIKWADWNSKRKHRCPYCSNNAKLSLDVIKKEFAEVGYTVIDTKYLNSKQPIKYKCQNGHIHYLRIDHFRSGSRCVFCNGTAKKTIGDVQEVLNNSGYKLISKEYRNVSDKITVECNKDHIYDTSLHAFIQGRRCPICNGGIRLSFDVIKESIISEGYRILTKNYYNSNQILELICPIGHKYYVSWNNWKHKYSRCTACSGNGASNQEVLIRDFIVDMGFNIVRNDREIIAPLELDIVIPEKKIAIEYCGLYWHSELMGKDRNYHINKLDKCTKNGYRLITIFEDEFFDNQAIVFSRISNILGVYNNVNRVYARKCYIKEIPVSEAREFCIKNHIQGYTGSSVKLGSFFMGKLISVMTFSKPSLSKGYRKNIKYMYELSRFCSKKNTIVVGMASKFIKFFIRNHNCSILFTYADRRWSVGNLYEKIGFKFDSVTTPNYWYFKNKKKIHRFALRKKEDEPKDISEWELRKAQGWNRIWDCGNLKYTYVF